MALGNLCSLVVGFFFVLFVVSMIGIYLQMVNRCGKFGTVM